MNKPVICLMWPTASGKTALAMALCRQFPLEIISVDSGMIYRGMDIGTAKPTLAEQAVAPHHLIDIIDPPEIFSAAAFCDRAKKLIDMIHCSGKIPILVGGTMMYFNALQKGLSTLPEANEAIRESLNQKAAQVGWDVLHQELVQVDPVTAARVHAHDTQRIQRALEVYYLTKTPLSVLQTQIEDKNSIRQHFENIILMPEDRAWLHQRIASRFALMCQQGFVAEVEQLLAAWPLTLMSPALRCVGYRQAASYLQGDGDYDSFCDKAVAATRQLAKRQLTWLRHWPDGVVLACDQPNLLDRVVEIIGEILDNS